MDEPKWERYYFEYRYVDGGLYGFNVMATSEEDAVARIRFLSANALLKGKEIMSIPAVPGLGWLMKLIVAIRNWLLNR